MECKILGRTGDKGKRRSKEQETRCGKELGIERRPTAQYIWQDRRQFQGKELGRRHGAEKDLGTKDEVQCMKLGRTGDRFKRRNEDKETSCKGRNKGQ